MHLVSLRQANRYLLRRQHLLTPCADPLEAVHDACGLQAQVPSSPALALRARVAGFKLADYDRLMLQDRSLVRTWAMRGTIHVLPADRLEVFTRVYAAPLTDSANLALKLLKHGPHTRQELIARAVTDLGLPRERATELFGPWGGILPTLARAGLTVHMPTETGADVPIVLTNQWLGRDPVLYPVQQLEDDLLAAYAHGYGPVSMRDFAHFTNFKVGRVRPIIDRALEAGRLTEVQLEGSRLSHYLPTVDLPELLATKGMERVRAHLLPRFDSLILAHKDKSRVLRTDRLKDVFRPAAVVEAVFLLRGQVAGTWLAKRTTRTLHITARPFDARTDLAPVEAEAGRLAAWYGLSLRFSAET